MISNVLEWSSQLDLLTRVQRWLRLMSVPMEILTRAITGGRLMLSLPSSMEQIKIMITIWPVQPVCDVWKHVFLKRPQRDNYCQLNYSACSPCVFWLRASDPLTLSSSMRLDLQPPLLFHTPTSTPLPNIHHNWGIQICTLQMSKMLILCHPSGKKKTVQEVVLMWVLISLCETVERSSSKTHSKNPGCLTETHTNTAIIGGRKLDSVAVANSLVQWNKALCCYVEVFCV